MPGQAPADPASEPPRPQRRRRRRPRYLPRRTRILIGVGTVGVVVVAAVVGALRTKASTSVGNLATSGPPAPAFSLPSVTDPSATVSLARYRGHPVVVNFFGSWCTACRQELPRIAAAARAHPGIQFIGVDLEDTRAGATAMMARYGVSYPAGFDPNDTVATKYHVVGAPTTAFIDARGRIVTQFAGVLDPATLDRYLSQLPTH